jgi:hypothetical protein
LGEVGQIEIGVLGLPQGGFILIQHKIKARFPFNQPKNVVTESDLSKFRQESGRGRSNFPGVKDMKKLQ